MSRFHTPIPVNIEEFKKLLPQRGVHVHGVIVTQGHDHKDVKVAIDWECSELRTGYTFPVDFSVEDLRDKKLPKGVTFVDSTAPKAKAPKTERKAPEQKPQAPKPPKPPKAKAPKTEPKAPEQKPQAPKPPKPPKAKAPKTEPAK